MTCDIRLTWPIAVPVSIIIFFFVIYNRFMWKKKIRFLLVVSPTHKYNKIFAYRHRFHGLFAFLFFSSFSEEEKKTRWTDCNHKWHKNYYRRNIHRRNLLIRMHWTIMLAKVSVQKIYGSSFECLSFIASKCTQCSPFILSKYCDNNDDDDIQLGAWLLLKSCAANDLFNLYLMRI